VLVEEWGNFINAANEKKGERYWKRCVPMRNTAEGGVCVYKLRFRKGAVRRRC
jgi:hypothetical protein